jgi:putative transposase
MPFKARFRQEIWSVDVRYIEEHGLGFPEPIYMISILENYSRSILASKMSLTQNQWDYMEVLFAALSRFGAPSALVSDGGGIFYCNKERLFFTEISILAACVVCQSVCPFSALYGSMTGRTVYGSKLQSGSSAC